MRKSNLLYLRLISFSPSRNTNHAHVSALRRKNRLGCGVVMSNELSSTFLNKGFKVRAPNNRDCEDDHLAYTMRKIGFIAACIDLHNLRSVIDEVLREIEAENEKRNFLAAALKSILPQVTTAGLTPSVHPTQTAIMSRLN
jgi:hypothetical protein